MLVYVACDEGGIDILVGSSFDDVLLSNCTAISRHSI